MRIKHIRLFWRPKAYWFIGRKCLGAAGTIPVFDIRLGRLLIRCWLRD